FELPAKLAGSRKRSRHVWPLHKASAPSSARTTPQRGGGSDRSSMPFWTKSDTPCKQSESGQAGHLAAYVVTPSSIHVTGAGIVAVVIVLATIALEAAQQVEIGLVEYDPEQIVVYARRHPERMFHHVDLLCAPIRSRTQTNR